MFHQQNLFLLQDTSKVKGNQGESAINTSATDIVIQVGAFRHESYAISLREKLSDLLNFTASIINEDNFFKVRITGFKSYEEVDKIIPTLTFLGIKNLWMFREKKQVDEIPQVVVQSDTSLFALKTKLDSLEVKDEKKLIKQHIVNLQVGVFHRRAKAFRARRKIINRLDLPVEIVRQWEYYIVIITGFKEREDLFPYYPKLAALGYPDSFMIDNNKGSIDINKKPAK
jgi:cell division protein FtsN